MMQDIRLELHFYGKQLDRLGAVYLATPKIPMEHPEILLFCLFTLRLLTDKKLSSSAAARIQQKLAAGRDCEKVFKMDEPRPFEPLMTLSDYSFMTKRVFRSQLLFRGEGAFSFVLGHSGFGIFSNKSRFIHCAEGAVLGLLEKTYLLYKERPGSLELLWQAAVRLSQVDFQPPARGRYTELAKEIYEDVCLRSGRCGHKDPGCEAAGGGRST